MNIHSSNNQPVLQMWEALSAALECTRIFELLPGQPGSSIQLHLREIKLASEMQYDAISYTWGDDLSTLPIEINGQPCEIRRNLWTFLDILRDSTNSRWLWADAICINQNDLTEKGQQVSIIGQIFKKAETVRAWLGEEADESSYFLSSAKTVVESRLYKQFWGKPTRGRLRRMLRDLCILVDAVFGRRELFSMIWVSESRLNLRRKYPTRIERLRIVCYKFFQRPYWTRTWVWQEVLLGKDCVFYCGQDNISQDVLLDIAWFFHIFCTSAKAGKEWLD